MLLAFFLVVGIKFWPAALCYGLLVAGTAIRIICNEIPLCQATNHFTVHGLISSHALVRSKCKVVFYPTSWHANRIGYIETLAHRLSVLSAAIKLNDCLDS